MKVHKIINTVLILCLGWIVACAPITGTVEITNSFNPNDLQVSIVQNPAGSNNLTLRMTTPGVAGFWAQPFGLGVVGFGDNIENFKFPLTGRHTFTFHVSTPFIPPSGNVMDREFITRAVEVDIQTLVEGTPPYLGYLVGDGGSKTWVLDTDARGSVVIDGQTFTIPEGDNAGGTNFRGWFMSSNYGEGPWGPGNPFELWWRPASATGRGDGGHMTFHLMGSAFNSYDPSVGANTPPTTGNGTWAFNSDFTELRITGTGINIIGQGDGFNPGAPTGGFTRQNYRIIYLSPDRMILFAFRGTGWTWVFRPE